jgi:hypothetical protein
MFSLVSHICGLPKGYLEKLETVLPVCLATDSEDRSGTELALEPSTVVVSALLP